MIPSVFNLDAAPAPAAAVVKDASFRALVENIGDVICLLDASARNVWISPSLTRVLGYTPAERLGKSGFDLLHPDHRARAETLCAELLRRPGATITFDAPVRHRDGSWRWVEAVGTNLLHDPAVGALVLNYRDITERQRAQENTERERLERALLEASEREQRRLGQDLHDQLCQHLLGVACMVKALAGAAEKDGWHKAGELAAAAQLVNGAVQQARDIARGLHPVELDAEGLMSALRELAARVATTVPCSLDCDPPVLIADPGAAMHFYRIAQEAVSNAVRHARATEIAIVLRENEDAIRLQVRDDGRGFSEEAGGAGMGLDIMKYRAQAIGGQLRIETTSGGGVVVTCLLPRFVPS